MSDTPRTDKFTRDTMYGGYISHDEWKNFARQLERELAEETALRKEECERLNSNIEQLNRLLESYSDDCAMMDNLRDELNKARSENLTVRAICGDKYPDSLLLGEVHNLRKRIEYLSIEVSFANRKRDEWKNIASDLAWSICDLLHDGVMFENKTYRANPDFAKDVLVAYNKLKEKS